MGRNRRIITNSGDETKAFGAELGRTLPFGTILCLFGEMGAGKTTLVKGLVEEVTGISAEKVVSPTFVYLNVYKNIYHFDLYRLSDCDEFISMGFSDYFDQSGICCIEWSERIAPILPASAWHITLSHLTEEKREIHLSKCHIYHNSSQTG